MNDNCEVAKRIIARDGETVVKANGDCTDLYYHIQDCEECARLREARVRRVKAEWCAECGYLKSQHRPMTRKDPSRPLGLEPTHWICPESDFSSRIRTFKPEEEL